MGMYSGLRGKVQLKPEVAELMIYWLYADDDICAEYGYDMWLFIGSKLENSLVLSFVDDRRSGFIPNGNVCYMPDDWYNENSIALGDTWNFCCSLKNYNGTIQKFIALLPEIAVAWDLEERYEEWYESEFHKHGELK